MAIKKFISLTACKKSNRMTPYRQNIINSYSYITAAHFLLFKGAFMLHIDVGIEDMHYYLENAEGIDSSIFDDSDDLMIKTITAGIGDAEILLNELEERNQLFIDDLNHSDIDATYDEEGKKEAKVNKDIGLVIFGLNVEVLSRTEKAIKALCEIKNEMHPANIKDEWQYEDDNIQLIAAFYRKLSLLVEHLEKETNSIIEKRNW
jgi:hypothetical protein